jgi:mannitol/fructose-specific phosphotransferase system IIA component (Ntr-type)
MPLQEIITGPDKVVLEMNATDRWSAIEELVAHLLAAGDIGPDDRDAVVGAVRQREETMSTGVGSSVGIPHAATPHVSKIVGVLGISQEGIEFDAMDGEPVHLVMLFLVPESHFQAHLDTLAEIARTLTKPERREALLETADPREVVRIIHEATS